MHIIEDSSSERSSKSIIESPEREITSKLQVKDGMISNENHHESFEPKTFYDTFENQVTGFQTNREHYIQSDKSNPFDSRRLSIKSSQNSLNKNKKGNRKNLIDEKFAIVSASRMSDIQSNHNTPQRFISD